MLSERASDKCFNSFCFESKQWCTGIMHINMYSVQSAVINSKTVIVTATVSLNLFFLCDDDLIKVQSCYRSSSKFCGQNLVISMHDWEFHIRVKDFSTQNLQPVQAASCIVTLLTIHNVHFCQLIFSEISQCDHTIRVKKNSPHRFYSCLSWSHKNRNLLGWSVFYESCASCITTLNNGSFFCETD